MRKRNKILGRKGKLKEINKTKTYITKDTTKEEREERNKTHSHYGTNEERKKARYY